MYDEYQVIINQLAADVYRTEKKLIALQQLGLSVEIMGRGWGASDVE
jgi:hypothetical protein